MKFSDIELSILGEVGNVSVGGAAASLSDFVNKVVTISIPNTKIQKFKDIKSEFEPEVVYTRVDYSKGLSGSNMLMLRKEEAFQLAKLVGKAKLDMEITEWNDFSKNVISEVFNIMAGNMSGSMSGILNKEVAILTPTMGEMFSETLSDYPDDEQLITIWFEIKIENSFKMKLLKIVSESQANEIIENIKGDNDL